MSRNQTTVASCHCCPQLTATEACAGAEKLGFLLPHEISHPYAETCILWLVEPS